MMLEVDFYENTQAPERVTASIEFAGVTTTSQITDFKRLCTNAGAGNINYWIPSKKEGTTYIYLMDGIISITASKVHVILR